MRYGLLLARLGRQGEAKAWLTEVLTQLRRAPAHVRQGQAEWIALAEKVVGSGLDVRSQLAQVLEANADRKLRERQYLLVV